ncbi:hypothetical protein ACHAXH_005028 [Discostella pseudostelligera]
MLIVEQEITEQSGDYSANDNSFDPVRIHCSFDTNPEQSVHDAFQAGVPFAEDWKLSNHQVQVYGVKTSANQCTSEQEMKSSDLSKFVKDCGLDLVADFLSQSPTLDHEPDSSQHLQEYTLRQWIMSSKPEIEFNAATSMQSSTEFAKYTLSALRDALKLTECLIEAEKDEQHGHINPIPLASIAPANVLIRATVGSEVDLSDNTQETIEFAWIMSFVDDDLATGE